MEFDAFTAGVSLGGLRSKNDIKLLICYMLFSVGQPLSKDEVLSALQEKGLANYFEINDAFSDLINNGNIRADETDSSKFAITAAGNLIATQLDSALPISVREKALEATLSLLAKIKRESENTVTIRKEPAGYSVHCNISGGEGVDLLGIGLVVPDNMQAELVKKNFQADPDLIYACTLALLTRDAGLIKNALETLQEDKV